MKVNWNEIKIWNKTLITTFSMKKLGYIILSLAIVVFYSCKEENATPSFEDLNQFSIYDYLMDEEHQERFSSFIAIIEAGGIDKTLSAYNPEGTGYTLFLPDNAAVDRFIDQSDQVSSLNDIVSNPDFASDFSRYHVVQIGVHTNDFPFGAFPELTLSNDRLTVSFIIESDTSYYKINNQATVIEPNIEVSNGYIHIIETALQPVSFTTYEWLGLHPDYSIFKEAVDLTGLQAALDINTREDELARPTTLLLESNEVFNDFNISSVNDLAALISPENNNYTSTDNPLYNFVAYHILTDDDYFVDDFEGQNQNYSTYADVPLRINGTGIDFKINQGKEVFDTIVFEGDSTFIDYIGFLYDESNVITQSGAIHMIDKLMKQQIPSRATQTFQFGGPVISELKQEVGTYELEKDMGISSLDWESAADLYFVQQTGEATNAWGNDYLQIDGDFVITFTIPKIVQGRYEFYLGAEYFSSNNASVEVLLDGKKIGSLVNLTRGGSANNPFRRELVGTVDFKSYTSHKVTVRSLIPGQFLWDYVRFEPI